MKGREERFEAWLVTGGNLGGKVGRVTN